jgi:hypothetical protein
MTQKDIRKKLKDLFIMVEKLESSMGFLPPVVDPNQSEWITNTEKQIELIKVEIDSVMKQLEI